MGVFAVLLLCWYLSLSATHIHHSQSVDFFSAGVLSAGVFVFFVCHLCVSVFARFLLCLGVLWAGGVFLCWCFFLLVFLPAGAFLSWCFLPAGVFFVGVLLCSVFCFCSCLREIHAADSPGFRSSLLRLILPMIRK